tara:strand:- start:128 stop:682 length:555 start_codon:yes stop_codon:yes gene_type:complete
MKEIFKGICGYEGVYSVSDTGLVRSERSGKILKFDSSHKYARVSLALNGNVNRFFVHRLVGESFIPNEDNKPCINHIDSNVRNNNVNNLEWCTYSENAIHSNTFGSGAEARAKATAAAAEKAKAKSLAKLKCSIGDRLLEVYPDGDLGKSRTLVKFKCLCGNTYTKRIDSVVIKRGGICSDCKG